MRKFQFTLAAVMKLRKSRENDSLALLAKAQRVYQAERDRKSALQLELQNALLRREDLGGVLTDVNAYRLEQDFITGTKQRIIQVDQAILRASRGVEKALRAYLIARRQTRMIEVLHDKAFSEFKRQEFKREQKIMDDLMIMRARFQEEIA